MPNCVQCGRDLPSFSFGETSNLCSGCRRQQSLAAQQQPAIPPTTVRQSTLFESARVFPVTTAIVAINLALYAACAIGSIITGEGSPMGFSSRMLLRWGADFGPLTLDGEWWRLFTSMWLHGGLIHVAANMYGLWGFGRITERIYGRSRYLVIYLVTGLASSLASVAWHSQPTVSVGASGAIFGVVGALVWPFYRKRLKLPAPVMSSMLRNIGTVIVINLVIGASIPVIDNAAHVGGLVAGLILGAVFIQLVVWGAEPQSSAWKVAAASAIVLVAAFVGIRPLRLAGMLPAQALYQLEKGDKQAALLKAQEAVQTRPNDASSHVALGEVYLQSSRPAEGAKEYAIAHRLAPSNTDIDARLGSAYVAINDWNSAEPVLRQALNADPKDPDVLTDLGVVLAATDRTDEGIDLVRQALQIDGASSRAQYLLGTMLASQGKLRDALVPLREAARLDPTNPAYQKTLSETEKSVTTQ